MRTLAERQNTFGPALFATEAVAPAGLVAPTDAAGPRRFAVYRNNVAVGFLEALRDAFPAVENIVGHDYFTALALAFARANPPATPVMLAYGGEFASFIERHEVAAQLPYLADVARCEWACIEAFHAPEARPLEASELLGLGAADAQSLRLVAHPSLRVVRSAFAALTIWEMNVGRRVLAPIDFEASSENALILRPHARVEVAPLSNGAADLVASVAVGDLLPVALSRAAAASPTFDPAAELGRLLESGAFAEEPASRRNAPLTRRAG